MESFDIDKISRKMPYAAPREGFFEDFAAATLARIDEQERERVRSDRRWSCLFTSSIAVAAMVAVALTTILLDVPRQSAIESFDSDLDQYVSALSDDELSALYYEVESTELFYDNL